MSVAANNECPERGYAGAVELGGSAQAAPAQFTVGEIGFGPNWQDDEPTLRELYDRACQSIVRLECEADELRAEVALLREEQAILKNDGLRIAVKATSWARLVKERDQWREECAKRLIDYAHESLAELGTWGNGYERYERQMEQIRADIAEFERLKGESK